MTQVVIPGPNLGTVNQGTPGTAWPVTLASVPTVTEKQDQPAATAATWTSATAANTALTTTCTGYGTATVAITVPSTVTAGIITLEVSNDGGTTYYPAGAVRVDNGYQENVVALALTPGIALNRMYAVSVDAMTQVRARLSTVITGTGNVVVTLSIVAGGIEPFVTQRSRKVAAYSATFRAATRPYNLSFAFTANTRKQYATIHHAATATKTVTLRSVQVSINSSSVAGNFVVALIRLTTAPATGNPAITPARADYSDAAAEATCLALPTTAATEGDVWNEVLWSIGVTGAVPTTNPPPVNLPVDLLALSPTDEQRKYPTIRAGVLEGWAVSIDGGAASTVAGKVTMEFTEEAP